MDADKRVYECDPEKNTECTKTSCYIYGGDCRCTTQKEYAKLCPTHTPTLEGMPFEKWLKSEYKPPQEV